MFKKSRRKIVAAIMSILVLLWVGTLGVIYASSYFEMKSRNEQLLKFHADMYTLSGSFDGMKPPNRPFPGRNPEFDAGFAESPMFQLSTFTRSLFHTREIFSKLKMNRRRYIPMTILKD